MNPLEELLGIIKTFERFLALKLAPSTCRQEGNRLKRFFTHLIMAKKDFKAVTQEDIETYLSLQRCDQHYKAHWAVTIRRFYNYLKDKRIVTHNPAEKIKLPYHKRRSLTMIPNPSYLKSLLGRLEKDQTHQGLTNRLMVELAYGSGLRRAEIATLGMADINMSEHTAHVLGKNRKERVVPLSRRCTAALKTYMRQIKTPRKPLLILDSGQRIKPWHVSAAIKKTTGHHAHFFRHACATHMLLKGCDIRYIQVLLGHTSLTVTQVYTHLNKEDLRQVINQKHPCSQRRRPRSSPSY